MTEILPVHQECPYCHGEALKHPCLLRDGSAYYVCGRCRTDFVFHPDEERPWVTSLLRR